MRIVICGSRSFDDADLLDRTMDRLTAKLDLKRLVVLSLGTLPLKAKKGNLLSRGADRLGEEWAGKRMVGMIQNFHGNYTELLGEKINAVVCFGERPKVLHDKIGMKSSVKWYQIKEGRK